MDVLWSPLPFCLIANRMLAIHGSSLREGPGFGPGDGPRNQALRRSCRGPNALSVGCASAQHGGRGNATTALLTLDIVSWSDLLTATITKETHVFEYDLDKEHSILILEPKAPLHTDDFVKLAEVVDPYIEATGDLAGLIIEAPAFPGWDSFGAMVTHLRFVRDHQKHVKKIAVVTASHLGDFAEHLASHFVSAEIRHFPAGQVEAARHWISLQ